MGAVFIVILYRAFFFKKSFFGFCIFLIIASVAWEVFEFFFNEPFFGVEGGRLDNPIWVFDTIKDLFVDLIAGVLWWRVGSSYNKHNV